MDPNFNITTGQSLQLTYSSLNLRPLLTHPNLLPIVTLPARRTLYWNPLNTHEANRYRKIHTIQSLHGSEAERVATAFAVQVAGVEARVPCLRCQKGDGEWAECVVPPEQLGLPMEAQQQFNVEAMATNQTQARIAAGQPVEAANMNASTQVPGPALAYPPASGGPPTHGRVTRSNTPTGLAMPPFNAAPTSFAPNGPSPGAATFAPSPNNQPARDQTPVSQTDESDASIKDPASKGASNNKAAPKKAAPRKKAAPKKKVGPPEPARKATFKEDTEAIRKASHVAGAGIGQPAVSVKLENPAAETSISPNHANEHGSQSTNVIVPIQNYAREGVQSGQLAPGTGVFSKNTNGTIAQPTQVGPFNSTISAGVANNSESAAQTPLAAAPVPSANDRNASAPHIVPAAPPSGLIPAANGHPVLGTFPTPKNTRGTGLNPGLYNRISRPNAPPKIDTSFTYRSAATMAPNDQNRYDPRNLRNEDVLDYYKNLSPKADNKVAEPKTSENQPPQAAMPSNLNPNATKDFASAITNQVPSQASAASKSCATAITPATAPAMTPNTTPAMSSTAAPSFTSSRMVLDTNGVPFKRAGNLNPVNTSKPNSEEPFSTFIHQKSSPAQSTAQTPQVPPGSDISALRVQNIKNFDWSNTPMIRRTSMPQVRMRPTERGPNPVPENFPGPPVGRTDPTLVQWPVINHEDFAAYQHVRKLLRMPVMSSEELEAQLDGWYEDGNTKSK